MARLHTEYAKQTTNEKPVSDTDRDIRNYIEKYPSGEYDQVLQQDSRWDIFFHLSEMRASILNWYEFGNTAEILEIGGGFGALTGMLCDKSAHVTTTERSLFRAETISIRYADKTNLDVYAGDLDDMELVRKFDYILLVGHLERQGGGTSDTTVYADYLRKLFHLMKPDGKLLLAAENRFGVRYFCGAPEPHTGQAFDGINQYPRGTKGYSFSRQELKDILKLAGLSSHKFYYPLPDYKLPQLIYSESYLPEKNIKERLIPYYVERNTLIAYENDLYDDLIDNHVFEFFANSFLVECALDGNFGSVIYAAVSGDRGKSNAFATTIHRQGTVKKTPLHPEGEENASQLFKRMMELKTRGLDIVPHAMAGSSLIMPYISSPTLSNYLKEIIRTDQRQVHDIFDRLYECILSSSDAAPKEENALCPKGSEELDWGVILRKAYLELIPLNSFYEDGKILFYDQEFVKYNCPAKYVLFRAIHYMYVFAPYTEQSLPLQSMKERYGLTELWAIFLAEENNFLADIRKHEVHRNFYTWARVDKKRMQQNAQRLAGDDKVDGNGYEVTEKTLKIRNIQLDLLSTFIEVCEKHGLKYYAIYGTLLGAVRHKGYIPWDDDVDIAMPREDYDRLKRLAPAAFSEPYFFQTPENNPDTFYGGFSRLRNGNTTGIGLMDIGHEGNQGIWIDILPMDNCTSDPRKLHKKLKKVRYAQHLLYAKAYGRDYEQFRELSVLEWKLFRYIAKWYSHKWLCRKLERAVTLYTEDESDYLAIFTHYNRHQPLARRDFDERVLLEFEGLKLPAPVGYKRCLEMSVGKDYMVYPPVEQRRPHHPGIFHPDLPYVKYKTLFFDLFGGSANKSIIVFGAGLMFEDYMKKYGDKYTPTFLVDNDRAKWGSLKQGIEIKAPDEIFEIPQDKRWIIICSVYYRQIEEQLKQMGVDDYRIYVQEKNWIVRDEEQGR